MHEFFQFYLLLRHFYVLTQVFICLTGIHWPCIHWPDILWPGIHCSIFHCPSLFVTRFVSLGCPTKINDLNKSLINKQPNMVVINKFGTAVAAKGIKEQGSVPQVLSRINHTETLIYLGELCIKTLSKTSCW